MGFHDRELPVIKRHVWGYVRGGANGSMRSDEMVLGVWWVVQLQTGIVPRSERGCEI